MILFTDIDEVRALVSTRLTDAELEAIVDREEAELIRRFGASYAATTVTETHRGGGKSIYLTRGASAITSIAEHAYLGDTAPVALVENTDFVPWLDQGRIERLYGRWGVKVVVVFTPVDDRELRRQVLIELIRIAVTQSAFKQETVQGFEDSYSYVAAQDWQQSRAQQYARLSMSPL